MKQMEESLSLRPVEPRERELLWALLQEELEELLPYYPEELDDRGQVPYPWFEAYFSEETRSALLIQQGAAIVGFALINDYSCLGEALDHSLAEFYIRPAFRRRGLGREAVAAIFRRYPGRWELKFHRENRAAEALWLRATEPWRPLRRPWEEDVVLSFTVD